MSSKTPKDKLMRLANPTADSGRIAAVFAKVKAEGRGALITFITAGDPDYNTSLDIINALPDAGSDIIELGMPFTDPMADGPAIQKAGLRALAAGQNTAKTLKMVASFRQNNDHTPIILMGYYNPIYSYGVDKFLADAKNAGVDGLIIVDLPPEEDIELCIPALEAGINFIRLATPTTTGTRIKTILKNTSGFIYYVSILGITGTKSANDDVIKDAIADLRNNSDLPIAVGFGIKDAIQAKNISTIADAAVVGSAIIDKIEKNIDDKGKAKPSLKKAVLDYVRQLAHGVRS